MQVARTEVEFANFLKVELHTGVEVATDQAIGVTFKGLDKTTRKRAVEAAQHVFGGLGFEAKAIAKFFGECAVEVNGAKHQAAFGVSVGFKMPSACALEVLGFSNRSPPA